MMRFLFKGFSTRSWNNFSTCRMVVWRQSFVFFLDLKYEWSLGDVSSVTSFDVGKSKSFFINGGVRISI